MNGNPPKRIADASDVTRHTDHPAILAFIADSVTEQV
jgi:hypothetical protein